MAKDTTHQDVILLAKKAFDTPHPDLPSAQSALKAVANNLLLHEGNRQSFADAGYATKTGEKLRAWNEDFVQELICCRILFLLTYKTNFDFAPLLTEDHLIDSLLAMLDFHARTLTIQARESQPKSENVESMEMRALSETLKLVFNLIQFYPDYSKLFQKLLRPILALLQAVSFISDPLRAPVNYLINVLLNIPLDASHDKQKHKRPSEHQEASVFPSDTPNVYVDRLIQILERAIQSYSEDSLELKIIPHLTLLRRLVDIAPVQVKQYMSSRLLPSDTERDLPLGSSNSLASKLLKLSNTPAAPQVREGVSGLLFELSDKDPATFVRNIGYGYASGYLMSHKFAIPSNTMEEDVGAKVTNVDGREINPVTGQRRDKEPPDPVQNMTDAEKEREAERLFVLFERLKSTGVVSVMNPVEAAAREGKLEEVNSSDSDE